MKGLTDTVIDAGASASFHVEIEGTKHSYVRVSKRTNIFYTVIVVDKKLIDELGNGQNLPA